MLKKITQDLALARSCTLQLARTCPEAENIEVLPFAHHHHHHHHHHQHHHHHHHHHDHAYHCGDVTCLAGME